LIHRSDLLEFYVLDGLSNLSFENEKVSHQIVDLGLEKIVEVLKSNDKPRIKYVAAKLLCSMYDSDNKLKEKIISSLNKEIKENIEILEKSEDKRISDMGFKFSSIFY
jgi:polyribonucleotide nucleotidyltransferase